MTNSIETDIFSGNRLRRHFLMFLLPLIGTNILQSLSMTINTIYVGQLLGVDAVAAVAVFMPVMFCLIAFIIGVSAGATVVVGQAYGAKNRETLYQAIGSMLYLALLLGLSLGSLGVYFTPEILRLLGASTNISQLAEPYFYTMMAGCPITFIFISITSAMRGIGDSVTPLLALTMTIILGLIITPALILGWMGLPELGTIAPAIATLASQIVSIIFIVFYLKQKNAFLQFGTELFGHIRHHTRMLKLILQLGIPNGVQMITTALAGLIIIRLINNFGSDATAAYGAITQVINYIQFPALSIGIAASIFAAQAIGAERSDRLRAITRTAMMFNIIFTGGLILLGYLFSRHIIALFITDDNVIELGQSLLHISLWTMIFFGATAILTSIMRASGTVWIPMFIVLAMLLIVELPLAYWLSDTIGLAGIWYSYAATFIVTFVLILTFYWYVWRKQKIEKLI
ncbi:MAG: MATE family efflux transporter [Cellvibrio sp.]